MRFGPYDDQYYYVLNDRRADKDGRPRFIGPVEKDEWTSENSVGYTANPSQLMRFEANYAEQRLEDNHPGEIGDINRQMLNLLVLPWVYEQIRFFNISAVQWMHAVYYDIYDVIHEPMFLMKFIEAKDYWSRERSELSFDFDEDDPDDYGSIDRLSLDEHKFSVIQEEERLAFKLGRVASPKILFHARIAEPLMEKGAKGVRFFKITEYEDGMEYR